MGTVKRQICLQAMSENQVQAKVLKLFSISSFEYFEVNGTNLSVGIKQLFTGDEVIKSAIK